MSEPGENVAGGVPHPAPKPPDNGTTGLPGLHTWPQLYTFVLACFVLWLVLLFGLELVFP